MRALDIKLASRDKRPDKCYDFNVDKHEWHTRNDRNVMIHHKTGNLPMIFLSVQGSLTFNGNENIFKTGKVRGKHVHDRATDRIFLLPTNLPTT